MIPDPEKQNCSADDTSSGRIVPGGPDPGSESATDSGEGNRIRAAFERQLIQGDVVSSKPHPPLLINCVDGR